MIKKLAIITVPALILAVFFTISCNSTKAQKNYLGTIAFENATQLQLAESMLRLDNFRDFDKAELEFLDLRLSNPDNPYIDGWLAQLYVAWAEQLRTEVHVLQWQLSAASTENSRRKLLSIKNLLEYRLVQLEKVKQNAGQLCNALISYNQDNYISHRVMADYYRLMGDYNMMQFEMLAVERLNPESVGLLFLKGIAMASFKQNYPAAIGFYNKALEKDPMFVKASYFKGLAYHAMKKHTRATNIMNAVLEKSPMHPGARLYLDANQYISSLREEIQELALNNHPTEEDSTEGATLVKYSCEWIDEFPSISIRIKGDRQQISDLLVAITLVNEQSGLLMTRSQEVQVKAGGFKNINYTFEKNHDSCRKASAMLIKLQIRIPGSDEYKTVEIKKTFLPRKA